MQRTALNLIVSCQTWCPPWPRTRWPTRRLILLRPARCRPIRRCSQRFKTHGARSCLGVKSRSGNWFIGCGPARGRGTSALKLSRLSCGLGSQLTTPRALTIIEGPEGGRSRSGSNVNVAIMVRTPPSLREPMGPVLRRSWRRSCASARALETALGSRGRRPDGEWGAQRLEKY